MEFFDQGDFRLKGMLTEVSQSHLKFRKVLGMVRIMAMQATKGASMVCSQFLVPNYQCGWELNHGDVFICIHGIQMHTDHWDFREILSWMALLFTDRTRWDLSWCCGGFSVLFPSAFGLGQCRYGCGSWLVQTGWRVRLNHNRFHRG